MSGPHKSLSAKRRRRLETSFPVYRGEVFIGEIVPAEVPLGFSAVDANFVFRGLYSTRALAAIALSRMVLS